MDIFPISPFDLDTIKSIVIFLHDICKWQSMAKWNLYQDRLFSVVDHANSHFAPNNGFISRYSRKLAVLKFSITYFNYSDRLILFFRLSPVIISQSSFIGQLIQRGWHFIHHITFSYSDILIFFSFFTLHWKTSMLKMRKIISIRLVLNCTNLIDFSF